MARASSFRHFSPRLTKLDKVSLLEVIMKKFFVRAVVAFALVFAVSVPVLADTIRLKDGSVIRGQIVSFKNEQFTILVGSGARGPVAAPGNYQVRLTVGSQSQTVPLELKLDPRVNVSQADLEQQLTLQLKTREELNRVYDAVNQIQDVRAQLSGLKRRLPENANAKTISASADGLDRKLVAVRDLLVNLTISANEDSLAYPPQLDAKLAYLAMDVGTADSAPTEAEQLQFEKLKRQSDEFIGRWTELQRDDLAAFQKLTSQGSLSTVVVPPPGRVGEVNETEAH